MSGKRRISRVINLLLTSLDISEVIPIDLFLDILSRLQYKTIAKCRCVSKLWSSIISHPDFIDLVLKRSSAHPCLLFTFFSHSSKSWFFFSSPQPIKPDQNLPLLAVHDGICFPKRYHFSAPVYGLLCSRVPLQSGRNDSKWEAVVYNPSTGESMTLPEVKITKKLGVRTYLGYDPVNRQSKVLCMSVCRKLVKKVEEYQVLTLRTEELSWRKIECSPPDHTLISDTGISINGVLYYLAHQRNRIGFSTPYMIVCFDFISEKFTFIDKALNTNVTSCSVLINYGGKLGVIRQDHNGFFSGTTTSLELWVLDGVKEHKWLKMKYVLLSWNNLVADHTKLNIVGMTSDGEFVFSPMVLSSDPFYIFFYDVDTNTIKSVEIQGIGPVRGQRINTFIDHMEDGGSPNNLASCFSWFISLFLQLFIG